MAVDRFRGPDHMAIFICGSLALAGGQGVCTPRPPAGHVDQGENIMVRTDTPDHKVAARRAA
ncbi:hypothetical protein GCM10011345_11540 [Gemmobacter megaterium]|nr:hypothetical protein GCM10011345_11540 [Gemmobacter megaterium]